ncbi:16S rRNA (uracil(1498)-N(3))-methyltransferase [Laspinema olomoucense]|uniref:16S rRNA (uracil(1498)-N(3))-methyltransferase n=1 Tax=Laspinema olomoucense TaxID=3231600 RepID=UPI0021BA3C5E|nr:16S rRNA (uracil(1498)-N(3))-methyltransferase [Laspinema sp. D3c]MCT7996862.1 16S rRNA (uracil(1498)-N(3))-methyltransferase [Laspinema sp. D3c]
MNAAKTGNFQQLGQLQRVAIAEAQFLPGEILLDRPQQHYLSRVLRLKEGDRFIAMDGQGQWWLAQLSPNPEFATVLESIPVQTELPVPVRLILALPKNGWDEVVRQTTELGVTTLVPVLSDRTVLNPSPNKLDRWRRIAREAAEQSERQIIPSILDLVTFRDYLALPEKPPNRYICVTRSEAPHLLAQVLASQQSPAGLQLGPLEIAVGPEGGWTPAEEEQAIASGFQPVSLGSRILRAVTAPAVALSLIAAALEINPTPNQSLSP